MCGVALFRFARWLVRDHAALGLKKAPETFPKQATIGGKYGNWLRCVGRHPSWNHWPEVWDGSNWLEGQAAVEYVLSLTGDSPAKIPESALEYDPDPPPAPKKETPKQRSGTPGVSIFDAFNREQTAEDVAILLEQAKWQRVKEGKDVWTFKRDGSANDQNGNLKRFNEVWIFYAFSPNTKIPAGQGLNPAQLRAEVEFGGHDTRHMNALALRLKQEGFVGLPPVTRTHRSADRMTSAPIGVSGHLVNGVHPRAGDVVVEKADTPPPAPAQPAGPLSGAQIILA